MPLVGCLKSAPDVLSSFPEVPGIIVNPLIQFANPFTSPGVFLVEFQPALAAAAPAGASIPAANCPPENAARATIAPAMTCFKALPCPEETPKKLSTAPIPAKTPKNTTT